MPTVKSQIGYCTNVHAGTDIATICSKLEEFAVPIAAEIANPEERLGVGLWLPFSAATELSTSNGAAWFAQWLADRRLYPFTMNGFPFDNFHLPIVKHRVYRPTWADSKRFDYTLLLARILAVLQSVPASDTEPTVGSISTLPIGWPSNNGQCSDDEQEIQQAGANLRRLAGELRMIERETGRRLTVAIEPEPGCLLDCCADVLAFFESQLPEANHRRYISVCHDVCHSAVMFEDQAETLQRYGQAGITVGKVQVSSAIDVPLSELQPSDRELAIQQLCQFAEDRYLHQTGCRDRDDAFRLVEDLPQWLSSDEAAFDKHIRIHFHVPIFLERVGQLRTTRNDIAQCISALSSSGSPAFTGHWEIETYAWTVMPEELRTSGLGTDIAHELKWFGEQLSLFSGKIERQHLND